MKKVFQLLGFNKPTPGLIGVEIEAEGKGLKEVDSKYWRTENDGSLRGHYPEEKAEFVMKGPIPREEVSVALKSIKQLLKESEFDFSYRTSVHVHVNVQELTYVQLLNYIYTYLLLEEPLMNYCGKSRKANRFCLRLGDAEGLLDIVAKMFQDGEGMIAIGNDNVRYSSINLAAIGKYGSLEFRGMRGNIDPAVNLTWVEALCNVREYAMSKASPREIRDEIEKIGSVKFFNKVLGDVAPSFVYPRLEKEMARSFSISIDLPYCYREKAEEVVKAHKATKPVNGNIPLEIMERLAVDARINHRFVAPMEWQANIPPPAPVFIEDL